MAPNADDLDDGLAYEFAESIDESVNSDVEEIENIDVGHEATADASVPALKRQQEDVADEGSNLSKRQKKLSKSKSHLKKMEKMEFEKEQKKELPQKSPEAVVDYLSKLIREKNPDMSVLELEELYFKKSDFISTESFTQERTLANFPTFAKMFNKAPRAIVLSTSNIRVADVFRSLGGSSNAVKLFSKNKLKDDLARLDQILGGGNKEGKSSQKKGKAQKDTPSQNVQYFLSTPGRMAKIIEESALLFSGKEKLDIIVDASYLDPKTNSIFTSDDGMLLCKLLKTFLREKSSVKILLF
ncbi:ADR341Wp [Eremothecium gossypii ATCC 10895]|uniref:ADR341Wp n=1 Tax=Eremothecium gossypii (strain ATCC 10895 / CBS 109.51 / FGSC 9923 / NRRL Y-1056) TaxID=284811 RepID=Q759D6_EREGS|nr:ADR341Wp [Eremothecium gossypii ATCC 10895]AAS52261.1 ADR341Wp [Eremothecium gossypii ATCC 10895]